MKVPALYYTNESYLSYLMPLRNPLAHFHADFLEHLDSDGISELTSLDRWFTSIFYHTSTDFKKGVLTCLEVTKADILPTGILTFPEICKELKSANDVDRDFFFKYICAYGTRDVLKPFIGAGFDTPQKPLDWNEDPYGIVTGRYGLSVCAFTNIETFESLAAAGIRITNFGLVLEVMSSDFLLERSRDRDFLERFFGLWSPSSDLRPLVLAHWLQHVQRWYFKFEDVHKAMINALIERDYRSFPCRVASTERLRVKATFLGVEVVWQVLTIITPRVNWEQHPLREMCVTILLHLLEQYRPFVELELDRRWLPPGCQERRIGFTPLMLAVVAGDLRLAVILVEHGAIITQRHASQNLSALDLAFRNTCCCHPRNWLGLPPSELAFWRKGPFWCESDTEISEEQDKRILEYLVEKSEQSPDPVNTPKQKPDGKFIPLPTVSLVLTSPYQSLGQIFANFGYLWPDVFKDMQRLSARVETSEEWS